MKIITCFLIFLVFFVSIHTNNALAEIPNSEKDLFEQIIKLESEKKYHTSLRLIEDFIQEYPESFEAKTYRCGALNNADYPINEIKQCLDEVALVEPTNLRVMMNYGVLYYKMEDYVKAKEQFKRILEIYPNQKPSESRYYVVSWLLEPDNEENIVKLKELFEETKDLTTLNNLIKILNDKNEFVTAKKLLDIALEMDNRNPDTLTHMGVWHAKQGDLQNAQRFFGYSLDEEPYSVTTLNNQALVYKDWGDKFGDTSYYQTAIGYYGSVLQLEPENIDAKNGIEYSKQQIDFLESIQSVYFFLGILILIVFGFVIWQITLTHKQYQKDQKALEKTTDKKTEKRLSKKILFSQIGEIVSICFVIIAAILIFAIMVLGISPTDGDDVSNWFSMILEVGVGAIIAISILSYERSKNEKFDAQQEKISNLITSIEKYEKQQNSILTKQEEFRQAKLRDSLRQCYYYIQHIHGFFTGLKDQKQYTEDTHVFSENAKSSESLLTAYTKMLKETLQNPNYEFSQDDYNFLMSIIEELEDFDMEVFIKDTSSYDDIIEGLVEFIENFQTNTKSMSKSKSPV